MRLKISLRARLASFVNDRTKEWNQAAINSKKAHPFCEICLTKKNVESHDVLPYHLLTDAQKHDYSWLLKNLMSLCRIGGIGCHISFGHCGDGNGLKYNLKIRDLAKAVRKFAVNCTK
jgi:hypothetical protein